MSRSLISRVIVPSPDDAEIVVSLRRANLVTFVLAIVVNGLGSTNLFGDGVGNVSNNQPTWITPAGYAFGIWGFIYTEIIVFSIYQILSMTYKPQPATSVNRESFYIVSHGVSVFFIISNILNAVWIVLWCMKYKFAALIIIILFAFALFAIYFRFQPWMIRIPKEHSSGNYGEQEPLFQPVQPAPDDSFRYKSNWNLSQLSDPGSLLLYWTVRFPFSLYFGWLVVACFANFFAVFYVVDINNPFETIPNAVAAVVVLAIIEGVILIWRQDPVPLYVATWALIAIANSNLATSDLLKDKPETKSLQSLVLNVAYVLAALASLNVVWNTYVVFRRWQRTSKI